MVLTNLRLGIGAFRYEHLYIISLTQVACLCFGFLLKANFFFNYLICFLNSINLNRKNQNI